MSQAKLKIVATLARKFMGSASRLVDAANALGRCAPGSRSALKAGERYRKADAEYDERYRALDELIDALDGSIVPAKSRPALEKGP